jgi:hypothetical protein
VTARLARIAPVLGLLVLAPWVGVYLLGNISARDLVALPLAGPGRRSGYRGERRWASRSRADGGLNASSV